jgi:hypothetical protein
MVFETDEIYQVFFLAACRILQTFQVVPFFTTPTKSLLPNIRSPEVVAVIIAGFWALLIVETISS